MDWKQWISDITKTIPQRYRAFLNEYYGSLVQVVQWVFAGAVAAYTVRAFDAVNHPLLVGLLLFLFAAVFALPVWFFRAITNEQRRCPECSKVFEVGDEQDLIEYEEHLWVCFSDLPPEESDTEPMAFSESSDR